MSKFINGLVFILVPTTEVTQEMVNFSTTLVGDLTIAKAAMPKRTISSTENCILEVEEINLSYTRVFDSYRWCTVAIMARDFPEDP